MKRMGLTSSCSQSSLNRVESDDQKTRERAIPLVGYRDIVDLEIRQGQKTVVLLGGCWNRRAGGTRHVLKL